MSIVERNVSVAMVRRDLENVPRHPWPEGYRLRGFQNGDEKIWLELQRSSDLFTDFTGESFQTSFGRNGEEHARRITFLCSNGGKPIGTAAAWYDDKYGRADYGRIHWVAIVPSHQGKGLAKPYMSDLLRRMSELGHQCAYLTTGTARVPAISLYLQFGFVPEIRKDEDLEIWKELRGELRTPPSLCDVLRV